MISKFRMTCWFLVLCLFGSLVMPVFACDQCGQAVSPDETDLTQAQVRAMAHLMSKQKCNDEGAGARGNSHACVAGTGVFNHSGACQRQNGNGICGQFLQGHAMSCAACGQRAGIQVASYAPRMIRHICPKLIREGRTVCPGYFDHPADSRCSNSAKVWAAYGNYTLADVCGEFANHMGECHAQGYNPYVAMRAELKYGRERSTLNTILGGGLGILAARAGRPEINMTQQASLQALQVAQQGVATTINNAPSGVVSSGAPGAPPAAGRSGSGGSTVTFGGRFGSGFNSTNFGGGNFQNSDPFGVAANGFVVNGQGVFR